MISSEIAKKHAQVSFSKPSKQSEEWALFEDFEKLTRAGFSNITWEIMLLLINI